MIFDDQLNVYILAGAPNPFLQVVDEKTCLAPQGSEAVPAASPTIPFLQSKNTKTTTTTTTTTTYAKRRTFFHEGVRILLFLPFDHSALRVLLRHHCVKYFSQDFRQKRKSFFGLH